MKHIVKRNGKSEIFDNRKLYTSIYASCLSEHLTEKVAEQIALKISKEVETWLASKNEVTSNDIRHKSEKLLSKIDPNAGYLYSHHRIMW